MLCGAGRRGQYGGPADAGRRSRSRRRGTRRASPAWLCARGGSSPRPRDVRAGRLPDRGAPGESTALPAGLVRPVAGIAARRRTVARPGSPLRAPRGGVGDRARPDWRASSGLRAPSDGCDELAQHPHCSQGSDNPSRDDAALGELPAESSGSGPQLPRRDHHASAASPRDSRRTPGVGTFPRKRACRPRAWTAPPHRDSRVPARRRGPPPGNARRKRRDRPCGAKPSP